MSNTTRHDFDLPSGQLCDCKACVVADGLYAVAAALQRLGNADASTPMGGMEALGAVVKDGMDGVAGAMDNVAGALDGVWTAVGRLKE